MRYQISSFELLKQMLAALDDNPLLPWNAYPCLEWPRGKDGHGYGVLRTEDKVSRNTHRVAYEMTYGTLPSDRHACHHCDNPACIRPIHLFRGTHRDNMQDMHAKGRRRAATGEASNKSHLTAVDILRIRELHSQGRAIRALGRDFSVSGTAIRFIVKRLHWTHV